jgi:predicted ATPase
MIREIKIKNYKSIDKLKLDLGRVNVFIGENGCGKSNILEAIALGSAAANDKVDNEFLFPRGIRVTEPKFMKSAFNSKQLNQDISISFTDDNKQEFIFNLKHDNKYSDWECDIEIENFNKKTAEMAYEKEFEQVNLIKKFKKIINIPKLLNSIRQQIIESTAPDLMNFIIFSPDYDILKTFEEEGQIQPLGIKGEGLLDFLQFLNNTDKDKIEQLKKYLKLIDWFEDFDIPNNLITEKRTIEIKDRYLAPDLASFSQKSSNEGFLFLLFYFCLFISDITPQFFAIDNIDNSLNPRLCHRLIYELVKLANENDKQVIFTTHNPAILDGLNLDDDEQRLYVISRDLSGHTKAHRINSPKPLEAQQPVDLSEAFLRGYIGGLPENF